MRDREGMVDLRFELEVDGAVDINALIIRSRYRGPFGYFSGRINDIEIERMFGMGEEFYLRC